MISQSDLDKIEIDALSRNIPVMLSDGMNFMIKELEKNKASALLEIGSAIGYSALRLVSKVDGLKVETIEIDEARYKEAVENIQRFNSEESIYLHHDDALTFNTEQLKIKEFDCLFIDAAKAQYQRFFEKYIEFVKVDGCVIVDNLDFHGMIHDIDHIRNRNTKQLVKKIKRFKDWIFDHEAYDVSYYEIGDGIVIIKRKESL